MNFLHDVDDSILAWFRTFWEKKELAYFLSDIGTLGTRNVLTFLVLAACGLLLCLGRYRTTAFVLVTAILGNWVLDFTKEQVARTRPPIHHELAAYSSKQSFPSGHSMLSAIVFLTLALVAAEFARNRITRFYLMVVGLLLIFLVGLSRIYLGAHYPTDVVAGWVFGITWALLWRGLEALSLKVISRPSSSSSPESPTKPWGVS